MQKTLGQISIGDTVFTIKKNGSLLNNKDRYGNLYHAEFKRNEVVQSLQKIQENNNIKVNSNISTYSNSYLFIIPEKDKHNTFLDTPEYIYFINESEYMTHVANFIHGVIKKAEMEIIEFKNRKEIEIINLREAYWDFLNKNNFILDNPEK